MRKYPLLCAALAACLSLAVLGAPAHKVTVTAGPECDIGFDLGDENGGWNKAKFVFQNGDSRAYKVTLMEARWAGDKDENVWTIEPNVTVEPGQSAQWLHDTYLPREQYRRMGQKIGMEGRFTLKAADGRTIRLPFKFTTKEAVLPEPLVSITGKYMFVSLQKSRIDGGEWQKLALGLMDQVYECMTELVGRRPFGGALSELRESPNRTAWAYAGNPIVLNDACVGQTVAEFKQGLMSFGWAHETGHNFDCDMDEFLRWDYASQEAQANLKAIYAFEHMPAGTNLFLVWGGTEYYPLPKGELMPVRSMGDRFFLNWGDAYIADPGKTWNDIQSDDYLSFYYRVAKVYGWDTYKRLYRILGSLKDSGKPWPRSKEGKINLMLAALNKAAGQNLLPTYRVWKFPVTEETLKKTAELYGL